MDSRDPGSRPYWVLIVLWGLPSRASAWACFGILVALAVGCIGYSFADQRFFICVLLGIGAAIMAAAALWYYLAIRWVDQHGRWR